MDEELHEALVALGPGGTRELAERALAFTQAKVFDAVEQADRRHAEHLAKLDEAAHLQATRHGSVAVAEPAHLDPDPFADTPSTIVKSRRSAKR